VEIVGEGSLKYHPWGPHWHIPPLGTFDVASSGGNFSAKVDPGLTRRNAINYIILCSNNITIMVISFSMR